MTKELPTQLPLSQARFWCSGHLDWQPIGEQSPDPRYCVACFHFLKGEAQLKGVTDAPWVPREGK